MFHHATELIWLTGWAVYLFGIYARNVRTFRNQQIEREQTRWIDALLDFTSFTTWQIIPLLYIFTSWFDYADYSLPAWSYWLGTVLFISAIGILWRAYHDLGKSWSPKLDTRQDQGLVTAGIYGVLRHPIYAGVLLWGMSHPFLFHNWIVGWGFLLTFIPLLIIRIPREEELMVETFGDEYRTYMRHTGGLIPRILHRR